MPVAVVLEDKKRFELKKLEGGYVEIRQMTYGERLVRSSMSTKMKVMADKKSEYAGELDFAMEQLAIWDFSNLIVDHNLEDQNGQKLNFKNVAHIKMLRSDVGEEVGTYIDKVNSFEDIDEGN